MSKAAQYVKKVSERGNNYRSSDGKFSNKKKAKMFRDDMGRWFVAHEPAKGKPEPQTGDEQRPASTEQ